jgi:hypothetical protein
MLWTIQIQLLFRIRLRVPDPCQHSFGKLFGVKIGFEQNFLLSLFAILITKNIDLHSIYGIIYIFKKLGYFIKSQTLAL